MGIGGGFKGFAYQCSFVRLISMPMKECAGLDTPNIIYCLMYCRMPLRSDFGNQIRAHIP